MQHSADILKQRIKGGALYYAIFVMLLLSMLSLLLLSYFELSYKEDALFYKSNELNQNIQSAITLISCQPNLLKEGIPNTLDIFDDGSAIINAASTNWGLLKKVSFLAQWRHLVNKKVVLMAEKEASRCALWMPDKKKYVSLVGNSYINGDCYLSELGLRKGNAEGRYFEGPYLHDGKMKKSSAKMPTVNPIQLENIFNYLKGNVTLQDSVVSYHQLKLKKEIKQSFKNKTLFLQSSNKITLKQGTITDNVIIYSADTIEVWPSVQLTDILLFAPTIIFKQGCKNRVQAFASNSIIVEQGCTFNYPTFLCGFSSKPTINVKIENSVTLNGGVIVFSKQPEETITRLSIASGTTIYGKVYVNGDISFKGKIVGSLYCDRFVHSTPRAFYENFLLDAIIDESQLPLAYASFCLGEEEIFKLKEVRLCN